MFIDYVTNNTGSTINSDMSRNTMSAQIQPNAAKLIGRPLKLQVNNDPKPSVKATSEVEYSAILSQDSDLRFTC